MSLSYLEWNDLLIKNYFNDEMAGKEVIIFADKETIDSIGSEYNEGFNEFCRCVKMGPPWAYQKGICQKAISTAKDWRVKKFEYPPYFAYLILFVTAATIENELNLKAYYPLLRRILGEPDDLGPLHSFDKMDRLWADLHKWSVDEKHESLGRYTFRIYGGKIHVGIPFSQAIFSEKERKLLHLFFWQEGFDPADPPSEITLVNKLAKWGKKQFTRRTIRLLESKDDEHIGFQLAIADLVMSDLLEWDQISVLIRDSSEKKEDESSKKMAMSGARICLELELFGGTIQSYIRIKTNRSFPDGGLVFDYNGQPLICRGMGVEGWSTKLEIITKDFIQVFNAATLDWKNSYSFFAKEDSWISRLRGSLVKVFLPGITEGLPDWIEVQRVVPGSKYLICCHKNISAELSSWGHQWNDSFEELPLTGLPQGWILFEAKGIRKSFPGSDALTLPNTSSFSIKGGIKIGKGNQYLSIVPPAVLVDRGADTGPLLLNKMPLAQTDSQNFFILSEDLPKDRPLIIELQKEDGTTIRQRTIYFVLPEFPVQPSKKIVRNKFGMLIDSSKEISLATVPEVSGVYVSNVNSEQRTLSFIPTYSFHRIIFVGKIAGQIIEWPVENLPTEWQPVWAILKIRRDTWKVHFCDLTDGLDSHPSKSDSKIPSRDIKRWKDAIYRKRDQILPPFFKQKQILWKEFVRFAQNV